MSICAHLRNLRLIRLSLSQAGRSVCGNQHSFSIHLTTVCLLGVRLKITVFGLTISSSWGNGHATPYRAIFRALHGMGHEVHFFEKDVPYYSSRRDFTSCDYCSLTLYSTWEDVRESALSVAGDSDVVITASYLPQGRRISDEVLQLTRPLRVFYDLDTPITLANLTAGNVEYIRQDQIREFDLVLSFTGGRALEELEKEYGARLARPLYGCVDPDVYFCTEPKTEFLGDLSYMGTFAQDRQAKLEALFLEPARHHPEHSFLLAGSQYPGQWKWPANVRRIEHVSPREHPQFYSSSRLTLNITREEMARNGWCPSSRFFEAAACGTPLITDWWAGLDLFFDLSREIRVVRNSEQVEEALAIADAELLAMAERARERTLDQHTGAIRAQQLLRYIEEAESVSSRQAATSEVA